MLCTRCTVTSSLQVRAYYRYHYMMWRWPCKQKGVSFCAAYPLSAGESAVPILFKVERTRDGHSFMTRTVKVLQRNKTIFVGVISFHKEETGLHVRARATSRTVRAIVLRDCSGRTITPQTQAHTSTQ